MHNFGNGGGGGVSDVDSDARSCYEQALKHDPDFAEGRCDLGFEGGREVSGIIPEIDNGYGQALKHKPDSISALSNIGLKTGDVVSDKALCSGVGHEQALDHKPGFFNSSHNLSTGGSTAASAITSASQRMPAALLNGVFQWHSSPFRFKISWLRPGTVGIGSPSSAPHPSEPPVLRL